MSAVNTVTEHVEGELKHTKCAAFDLDDTLIEGASKESYRPVLGAVTKLKALNVSGYNLLVFSNQKRPRQSDRVVSEKIEALISFYPGLSFHIFCARAEDKYRKPEIGMMSLVPSRYGKVEFYVGDADGSAGAHSDVDLGFARGLGMPFFTPAQYFNPYPLASWTETPANLRPTGHLKFLTLVIMVGYPGSGKSSWCRSVLSHYERVSRDELKTMPKCISQASVYLKAGRSVVVDNCSPGRADRAQWVALGKETGADVVVVHSRVPMVMAMAWNRERSEGQVPDVVYYKMRKAFELPTPDEGIDHIYSLVPEPQKLDESSSSAK